VNQRIPRMGLTISVPPIDAASGFEKQFLLRGGAAHSLCTPQTSVMRTRPCLHGWAVWKGRLHHQSRGVRQVRDLGPGGVMVRAAWAGAAAHERVSSATPTLSRTYKRWFMPVGSDKFCALIPGCGTAARDYSSSAADRKGLR
jgi:hypothetical protein